MDAADSVDDSKVIIQCVDPSNILEPFEAAFSKKTPLRNLHWKSPSRPLRSISVLNVSLVREDKDQVGQGTASRRHQIPGLRQTPYVKLFLLRCDDKETYKEKWRKELKQWVKNNAPPGEGKTSQRGQERHDACEYLILHVVVPGTPAATQLRSSKGLPSEFSESTESLNNKGKWTGKSSATIYDRLRSDFDSNSKITLNRVGQVRLIEAGSRPPVLSPSELEEQWQDFIESLKACILASFDARVAQYEEDIRERETHRSRPGWNFCTFFVLKEGLANAFESVGLFDDAMGVYDELSLGLDGAVQEQADPNNHNHVAEFLPFAKDLKGLIREAIEPSSAPISTSDLPQLDLQSLLRFDKDRFPFDLKRKDYLEQILASDVSVLNFRIYIFTRQMEIYLRSTRKSRSVMKPSSSPTKTTRDDVTLVAELVEKAITFISLASRSLKNDLLHAWGGQEGLKTDEAQTQRVVTGNIAASWTWCAMMQILDLAVQTLGLSSILTMQDADTFVEDLASGVNQSSDEPNGLGAANHPTPRLGSPRKKSSHDGFSVRSSILSLAESVTGSDVINISRPGSVPLARSTALLLIAVRRILENMPSTQTSFQKIEHLTSTKPYPNSTNGVAHAQHGRNISVMTEDGVEVTAGLSSPILCRLVDSFDDCAQIYKSLSIVACRLFDTAGGNSMAEQILIDLALMEYRCERYDMTAFYLQKIPSLLSGQGPYARAGEVIGLLADCYKRQEQFTNYATSLILYLDSVSSRSTSSNPENFWKSTGQRSCDDLIRHAGHIQPTIIPLAQMFEINTDDCAISHSAVKDGFRVNLRLRCRFPVVLSAPDELSLLLVAEGDQDPNELQMIAFQTPQLTDQWREYLFETTTTTTGFYRFDILRLIYGNLTFEHDYRSPELEHKPSSMNTRTMLKSTRPLFVYPRSQALQIRAYAAPNVHLASSRRIALELKAGDNDIEGCDLRIKVGTAGVRLHIHEGVARGPHGQIKPDVTRDATGTAYRFGAIANSESIVLEIPYLLENRNEGSLSLRIEADYRTEHGEFASFFVAAINIILPITVNVTDHFRNGYMYSCFTFSPATLVPLQLLHCSIEEHDSVNIEGNTLLKMPVTVFPRQPFSWMVRFRHKEDRGPVNTLVRLTLMVQFRCLDEMILSTLERVIADDLGRTPLARYVWLLRNHLIDKYETSWTEQDLEVVGLLQEIQLWNLKDLDWKIPLSAVEPRDRIQLEEWLSEWHASRDAIKLTANHVPARQLKLFVELAKPPFLVATSLELPTEISKRSILSLGKAVSAIIEFDLGAYEGDVASNEQIPSELSYEVTATPESWLIGGWRKGLINVSKGSTKVHIILIPQRAGQTLLPQVSVRGRRPQGGANSFTSNQMEIPIEVHNKSQARTVLVVSDLQSTVVEVPEDQDVDGAHILVQSTHRNAEPD